MRLVGNDTHRGALALVHKDAHSAGVLHLLDLYNTDVGDFVPPAPPALVVRALLECLVLRALLKHLLNFKDPVEIPVWVLRTLLQSAENLMNCIAGDQPAVGAAHRRRA